MKVVRLFAWISVFALPLLADSLVKYKDWGTSPQSYFMTRAERDLWSAIKTDADAETFVNQFLASRGPGFPEDVASRAAAADKYLTVGSLPGSRTLRGKVIVLLGPPTSFGSASKEIEGAPTSSMSMYGMSDGGKGGGQGASPQDMADAAQRRGMSGKTVREFTILYNSRKLPPSFDRDLQVIIDADPQTGKDRLADPKQATDLDRLFEMVAVASVKTGK